MPRRATTFNNFSDLAVARHIDSKYDAVKQVASKLADIETVAGQDVEALVMALNEALDFTGIVVQSGAEANWDPTTKVLTVPTLQGEQGIQGEQGLPGQDGADGADGATPQLSMGVDPNGDLWYDVTYV